VADIFHEVDEEVRRDQLKKLWDRYSIYIIALAVLFVAAIAAWRGYEYYVAKKAAVAGGFTSIGQKCGRLLELGRDAREARVELAANRIDDGDNRDRDAGGDQTIFDGGGFALIFHKCNNL